MAPIQDLRLNKMNDIVSNTKNYVKKNALPLTGFDSSESIHETYLPRQTSQSAISPTQSADTNSEVAPEIESNGTHKS